MLAYKILLTPVFFLISTLDQSAINTAANSVSNFSNTSSNSNQINLNMSSSLSILHVVGFKEVKQIMDGSSYYDPKFMNFGALRVINEDRVAPGQGFPTHPHANAEIFSYIVSGKLGHKDSMNNVETLDSTKVQFTSAGTGISHSEYNGSKDKEVHFLQIWYTPDQKNLPPKYYTSDTPSSFKKDKLHTLIKPYTTFRRPIPAHSSLVTRASILYPSKKVSHVLGEETGEKEGVERWLYAHLAQTSGYKDPEFSDIGIKGEASIQISSGNDKKIVLKEGDGVFIKGGKKGDSIEFENLGSKEAEFLIFDVKPQ